MTSLPPPSSGPYAYNTFVPLATYADPVHGTIVRRVTTDHGRDDLYGRNMCWSSDGRRYLHRTQGVPGKPDAWDVIDVRSGIVTHTGIPFGTIAADGGFDAVDADVLYALSGREIRRILLQSCGRWTDQAYFTAPDELRELGGSINWQDRGGRFMLVRYGPEPSVRVYDRRNLAAGPYANPIDATNTIGHGSYLGLSPNGRYVVGFDSRQVGLSKVGQGVSWALSHAQWSVASSPTTFWSLCGDHGAFVSASDGRDYMVTYNCYSHAGLWRVDITNSSEGLGEAAQMALPGNQQLLAFDSWNDFGHVASVARGPRRDWVYVSTEDTSDRLNGSTDPWHAYRQEILAVNVSSSQVWRAAHHRSRELGAGDDDAYYAQPRVSTSWDGSTIGFASNFNRLGVVDVYAMMI